MASVHRRKSSKEEDEDLVIAPNGLLQSDDLPGVEEKDEFSARNRDVSSPSGPLPSPSPPQPTSAGPFRTGFKLPQTNGYSSTLRSTFSTPTHLHIHGGSRTRSISSGPFTPTSPSPLSMSFPSRDAHSSASASNAVPFPSSATLPEFPQSRRAHSSNSEPPSSPSASTQSRRHSRLHSRNLSIFFPRPGSLPHSAIAEDGTQELEIEPRIDSSAAGRLGEGFTFGARPPPAHNGNALIDEQPPLPRASRRGHHHKHSLSHNFFSFLEPGSTGRGDLTSQPTPTPISPWAPISPFPPPTDASTIAFPRAPSESPSPVSPRSDTSTSPFFHMQNDPLPIDAIAASLGSLPSGVGSLACTGLGYWVVFDAIGVAVSKILPAYLRRPTQNASIRRPFGTRRLETVALFAQVVYLMFSAVYVFKETVEHVLLSAGEGHHHHPGDEDVETLGKLVNVTGNQLPPLSALFDPSRFQYSQHTAEPSSRLDRLLRNPFSLVPVSASLLILLTSAIISSSSHRTFDLLLAAAEATAMFHLAYPSTAPARGLSAGRMESFLRAMREIERHPQVLHLPPPHIWQLAPSVGTPQPLVATLELRVAADLGDAEVLKLTRWAWERCMLALGLAGREQDGGGVTVGIVRG
ncbi:hypothetical protein EDB89DRAFT_2070441 [Lactarius sanguifluus]|nr:hypothetical protein EDB89DRAFT_2070441 [Lactarius sanguifluus]